jgi:hypothetical protein
MLEGGFFCAQEPRGLKRFFKSRSSSGLGHRPFTAATRVRLPYGTPLKFQQVAAAVSVAVLVRGHFQGHVHAFRASSSRQVKGLSRRRTKHKRLAYITPSYQRCSESAPQLPYMKLLYPHQGLMQTREWRSRLL